MKPTTRTRVIVYWLIGICLCLPCFAAASEAVDATRYNGAAWSPYITGAGIGVLLCLTMFFSNKPVGASSAYATIAGLIGKILVPHRIKQTKYFQENPPKADWELTFVLTTIVGAFVAAFSGRELTMEWLHPIWVDRFGEGSLWLRGVIGIAGGACMAFGARLAKGCTSGHGISGAAQLNVASWIALLCFFMSGLIIANLLFRT